MKVAPFVAIKVVVIVRVVVVVLVLVVVVVVVGKWDVIVKHKHPSATLGVHWTLLFVLFKSHQFPVASEVAPVQRESWAHVAAALDWLRVPVKVIAAFAE